MLCLLDDDPLPLPLRHQRTDSLDQNSSPLKPGGYLSSDRKDILMRLSALSYDNSDGVPVTAPPELTPLPGPVDAHFRWKARVHCATIAQNVSKAPSNVPR